MRRRMAAGNWKMHGLIADLAEVEALSEAFPDPGCDIVVCPPATLLNATWEILLGSPIAVGGQDCHAAAAGAHTGDVSAAMLADAGATFVILGHSERRADHGETDAAVRAKAQAAHAAGLTTILCLGETETQRDAGETLEVVERQLRGALPAETRADNTVIAYEPVWAIGTGRTASTEQIAEVHRFIRRELQAARPDEAEGIRILYGGSVKPANAAAIFTIEDVDGALVGGASLKAADFSRIIRALETV